MHRRKVQISILFIGNSFSYYNSLPKLVAQFARASGHGKIIVDGVFQGGATLKMFWRDGKALKKIRSRDWDYVVLQERGRLGGIIKNGVVHVGKPREFFAYATRFNKEIKKVGATTVLYCPPSFIGTGLPDDAKKLNNAFTILTRRLHAIMIPSITAFALALKNRPDLNLYEHNGQHPSPLGTYLIASLFYKKLFRKRISNFPLESFSSRLEGISKNPRTVRISKAGAQFLWSIANQIN